MADEERRDEHERAHDGDERDDDERDERDDETDDDSGGDESDESGEGERETWHQPPAHPAPAPDLTLTSIRETIAAQSQLIQTLIQQQKEMADRHERHLTAFRQTLEVQRDVAQTMNEEIKSLGEARTELGKVTAAMVKIARVQQETLEELQAEADEESE